ncbi:hypothetical protein GF420_04715 [candidate division GN15 bacterium]|nr:hypothetical protein [candidate division GN15 bacterium]
MNTRLLVLIGAFLAGVLLAGCGGDNGDQPVLEKAAFEMQAIASSQNQWTGLAKAPDGRMFVNFPRWSDDVPISVGVLNDDGTVAPYPNDAWNAWEPGRSPTEHFVCVQAVFVDDAGFLWILDPANPKFAGVVPGGPKLLKVDLATDSIIETYSFDSTIAPPASYLNDVRIDTARNAAFISESGTGALVTVDLNNGNARRLLDEHYSTQADDSLLLIIEGEEWRRPDGSLPQVHCDGIALSPNREYMYYQALSAYDLYRIPVTSLLDTTLTEQQLADAVEFVASSGAADGIIFDRDGYLYLSALEQNAINRLTPMKVVQTVVQDDRISWPDTFTRGGPDTLYFTTARIHEGGSPDGPYQIFRLVKN